METKRGKIKPVGRLAEAQLRVERDLALLYGVGYWSLEEWIVLDGLIHKGEYLFTNGPGKPLVEIGSPIQDSVKGVGKGEENDVDDLLMLDDDSKLEESVHGEVPEQSPSPRSGETTHVKPSQTHPSPPPHPNTVEEDKEPTPIDRPAQESTEVKTDGGSQSAATPLQPTTLEKEEEWPTSTKPPAPGNADTPRAEDKPQPDPLPPSVPKRPQTKTNLNPKAPVFSEPHLPPLPPILQCAPRLAKPFKDNETLPHIRMKSCKSNHSGSGTVKILQMEKGDMIELYKFVSGHKFLARNLKSGQFGQIHEEIFFPDPWVKVVGVLDRHRDQIRRLQSRPGKGSGQSAAASRRQSPSKFNALDSHECDAAKAWEGSDTPELSTNPYADNQFPQGNNSAEIESSKVSGDGSGKEQGDKRFTCWFWATRSPGGGCSLPEDKCMYSHHHTGTLADAPFWYRGSTASAGSGTPTPVRNDGSGDGCTGSWSEASRHQFSDSSKTQQGGGNSEPVVW